MFEERHIYAAIINYYYYYYCIFTFLVLCCFVLYLCFCVGFTIGTGVLILHFDKYILN